MRNTYTILYMWIITLLFAACMVTDKTDLPASSLGNKIPYPIEVPTMRIQDYPKQNVVIEVSREWPGGNKPPDFQYAEPPIAWPNPIKVAGSLEIAWITDMNPVAIDVWLYDKRDANGIPINDPIVHYKCRSDESAGQGIPLCNFSYESDSVIIRLDLPTQTYKAEILIVQAEWLTSIYENSRVARASWAVILTTNDYPS